MDDRNDEHALPDQVFPFRHVEVAWVRCYAGPDLSAASNGMRGSSSPPWRSGGTAGSPTRASVPRTARQLTSRSTQDSSVGSDLSSGRARRGACGQLPSLRGRGSSTKAPDTWRPRDVPPAYSRAAPPGEHISEATDPRRGAEGQPQSHAGGRNHEDDSDGRRARLGPHSECGYGEGDEAMELSGKTRCP